MHRLEQDRVYKHFIERTRLGALHKLFLHAATALLWLSGAAWVWIHYFADESPASALAMKIHGAAAMAFMLVIGSLVPIHIRRGWVLKRNVPSGMIVTGASALLIATGWVLYYLATENVRGAVSVFHWALGLTLPVFIVWHILAGREL